MQMEFKCRLCLDETSQYVQIFEDSSFPEMINLLTGIKVEIEDGLPSVSCLQCHREVKSAMLTRYQIINSHKILIEEIELLKEAKASASCKVTEEDTLSECSDIDQESTSAQEVTNLKIEESLNDLGRLNENSTHKSKSNLKSSDNSLKAKVGGTQEQKVLGNKRGSSEKHFKKGIRLSKLERKNKTDLKDKIRFKKKPLEDNSLSVKINYAIKAEHQEFLKSIGKKERVSCPECGREMFGINMRNHLITHYYDPVVCDVCGKSSKNAQALQDHINYYHKTTPDRFMCDKCGKGYRVRFMLERHEKKEHGTGEREYECSVCGKKFFEKMQLKSHINITHRKLKAYKCEHCGKDFGRRTQFVIHQLVHTKELRYHCQVCGRGFKVKQTMQTHLKGVHGIEEEKTVFCTICKKGFSSAVGLRAHINSRIHGQERCEHCSEFIYVEYKNTHLKDIHGINVEPEYS